MTSRRSRVRPRRARGVGTGRSGSHAGLSREKAKTRAMGDDHRLGHRRRAAQRAGHRGHGRRPHHRVRRGALRVRDRQVPRDQRAVRRRSSTTVASESDPYLLYHPCLPTARSATRAAAASSGPEAGQLLVRPRAGPGAPTGELREPLRLAPLRQLDEQRPGRPGHRGRRLHAASAARRCRPTPPRCAATPGRRSRSPARTSGTRRRTTTAKQDVYYDYPTGTGRADDLRAARPDAEHGELRPGHRQGPTPTTPACRARRPGRTATSPTSAPTPSSASPWGAYDMGGNLFQWTDDISYAVVGQYHAGPARRAGAGRGLLGHRATRS